MVVKHNMDDTVLLTQETLSVEAANKAVIRDYAGGTSLFVGTTRETFEGKVVTLLEYEAYESMAVKEMQKLCERAREQWPQICAVAIMHRLGCVPVGQASVIIAVSSPHRKEAIGRYWSCSEITRVMDHFLTGPCVSPAGFFATRCTQTLATT